MGGAPSIELRTHNKLNQITALGVSAGVDAGPLRPRQQHRPPTASRGNGNIIDDGTRINAFDALNRLSDGQADSDGLHDRRPTSTTRLAGRILDTVSNGGLTGTIPNGTSRMPARRPADRRGTRRRVGLADNPIRLGPVHRRVDPAQGAHDDRPAAAGGRQLLPAERPAVPHHRPDEHQRRRSSRPTTPTPTATRCCSAGRARTGCGSRTMTCRRRTRPAGMCSRGGSMTRRPANISYRARYYNFALGRFISRDPIFPKFESGKYNYAMSNPTRRIDP